MYPDVCHKCTGRSGKQGRVCPVAAPKAGTNAGKLGGGQGAGRTNHLSGRKPRTGRGSETHERPRAAFAGPTLLCRTKPGVGSNARFPPSSGREAERENRVTFAFDLWNDPRGLARRAVPQRLLLGAGKRRPRARFTARVTVTLSHVSSCGDGRRGAPRSLPVDTRASLLPFNRETQRNATANCDWSPGGREARAGAPFPSGSSFGRMCCDSLRGAAVLGTVCVVTGDVHRA